MNIAGEKRDTNDNDSNNISILQGVQRIVIEAFIKKNMPRPRI